MKRFFFVFVAISLLAACGIRSGSDRKYDGKEGKVYALRLNPVSGSRYDYLIKNETEVKLAVGDRKMDNQNRSDVETHYTIGRDSVGDFRLGMVYDRVRLYSKNNDQETQMDASNADKSLNPIEKMLGALQSAHVEAVISPAGEVKGVKGYKEIGDKLMASFPASDDYSRNMARGRMDQLIGDGIIKRNMSQLFRIFPDSAVAIGGKWTVQTVQKGDFNMRVNSVFTLRSISDGVATIDAEGDLQSDSSQIQMMGYDVNANLKGHQQGTYRIEAETGMLLDCTMTAKIEGSMQMLGREIPVALDTKLEVRGRRKEGK